MKTFSLIMLQLHAFLIPALDWDELPGSHPNHFTPGVTVPGNHWIVGWVGRRVGLDAVVGGLERF